jgi:hypothetical protein
LRQHFGQDRVPIHKENRFPAMFGLQWRKVKNSWYISHPFFPKKAAKKYSL